MVWAWTGEGGSGCSLDAAAFSEMAGRGSAGDWCWVSFGGCCHPGWDLVDPLQRGSQPGSWSRAKRPPPTFAASRCHQVTPNTKRMGITLCSSLVPWPGANPLPPSTSGLHTVSTRRFVQKAHCTKAVSGTKNNDRTQWITSEAGWGSGSILLLFKRR